MHANRRNLPLNNEILLSILFFLDVHRHGPVNWFDHSEQGAAVILINASVFENFDW